MGIGKRIEEAMRLAKKTPVDIARHLDISDSAVHQWFAKDTGPKSARVSTLAAFLGVTPGWLISGEEPASAASELSGNVPLRLDSAPLPPLILWRAAPSEGGEPGGWMLKREKTGEVERPDRLKFSKRAFAVEVQDSLNDEVFRARDTLLINPDRAVLPKDDGLFTGDPEGTAGAMTVVGQLIRSTPNDWIIRQYAVKGERRLSRLTYPNAWFVAGVFRS